jgi:hypothetical protein
VKGLVSRGGKPVGGGRVGGWLKRRREMDRVNVGIMRGRTLPIGGYEFARTTVNSDGTFALENLKAGTWFFLYEELTGPPMIVGPVTITNKDRTLIVNIALKEGGAIEGRVADVPAAMAGQIWVIAFDPTIQRREVVVSTDGSFSLGDLPAGRYGLKAGHDAYIDPHVARSKPGEKSDPRDFERPAEPWQGAVVVTVEPGQTVRGVVVDFGPPGPLVEPSEKPGKTGP